jgi:hypothetical protein
VSAAVVPVTGLGDDAAGVATVGGSTSAAVRPLHQASEAMPMINIHGKLRARIMKASHSE